MLMLGLIRIPIVFPEHCQRDRRPSSCSAATISSHPSTMPQREVLAYLFMRLCMARGSRVASVFWGFGLPLGALIFSARVRLAPSWDVLASVAASPT